MSSAASREGSWFAVTNALSASCFTCYVQADCVLRCIAYKHSTAQLGTAQHSMTQHSRDKVNGACKVPNASAGDLLQGQIF